MTVRSFSIRNAAPSAAFFWAWWDELPQFPEFRDYLSITNVRYDTKRQKLLVGICSFAQDILYEFDSETKEFESLGVEKVADSFDVKVHKSLNLLANGDVMTASAGLHVGDKWLQAPGGKIFVTSPTKRLSRVIGIPVPHEYIQCLSVDETRSMAYGFTYPGHLFFQFDLNTNVGKTLGCMSIQPHNLVVDREGGVWGMWDRGRSYHLFRYHPDGGFRFIRSPLLGGPTDKGSVIDAIALGDDGRLYIAQSNGNLSVFDPNDTEERIQYLGRPWPYPRMPGLIWTQKGLLAACGDNENTAVLRIDPSSGCAKKVADLVDEQNMRCWRVHDIDVSPDGRIFVAETDHLTRSGRLWMVS